MKYVFVAAAALLAAAPQDPCRSGLQPGLKPGPYSAVVITGPNRGVQHCYICETADKPAAIIFARSLSEPLGKLAARLDKAMGTYKDSDFRAWVTLLHEDQTKVDAKVVQWSKKHALSGVTVAVFEDAGGPPSYKLNRDADVTVLLYVKQKVVANFAFREGELTDARIDEVLKAVPGLVK